jgi:hypothetical protein
MSNVPERLALSPEAVAVLALPQNPTNIHGLRLSQDFESLADVTPVVTTVTIGKPNRHTFFQVHPQWAGCYPILEHRSDMKSEFYIVDSLAVPELQDEVTARLLASGITRDGRLFVWPLRIGNGEKQLDQAASSALAAMRMGKTQWIKVKWNGHSFDAFVAKKELDPPVWPETTFERMIEIAFEGRVITKPDHPVVKALLGEE